MNGLNTGTNTDGNTLRPCPNLSLGFTLKQTVTLTATQSITKINAWSYTPDSNADPYNNIHFMTQLQFELNDGSTQTVSSPRFSSASDTLYTYTTPAGKRFLGFSAYAKSGGTSYNFQRLVVYYGVCLCTQSCAISVDLSAISPQSKEIYYAGSLQTSPFTVTDNIETCGVLNI